MRNLSAGADHIVFEADPDHLAEQVLAGRLHRAKPGMMISGLTIRVVDRHRIEIDDLGYADLPANEDWGENNCLYKRLPRHDDS